MQIENRHQKRKAPFVPSHARALTSTTILCRRIYNQTPKQKCRSWRGGRKYQWNHRQQSQKRRETSCSDSQRVRNSWQNSQEVLQRNPRSDGETKESANTNVSLRKGWSSRTEQNHKNETRSRFQKAQNGINSRSISSKEKASKWQGKKPSSRKVQFTEVWEEDGSLTIDRGRIYNRAQKFYEKLNSSDPRSWTFRPGGETWVGRLLAVELAIKQSKKGKAPELDNITIDLIEATGETIYTKLAALFNEYLIRESKVPGVWNEVIIILLNKKGDPKNISNHRSISLLNNIYKLFTKVITYRMTSTPDRNQRREQTGFRKGFSSCRGPWLTTIRPSTRSWSRRS